MTRVEWRRARRETERLSADGPQSERFSLRDASLAFTASSKENCAMDAIVIVTGVVIVVVIVVVTVVVI